MDIKLYTSERIGLTLFLCAYLDMDCF